VTSVARIDNVEEARSQDSEGFAGLARIGRPGIEAFFGSLFHNDIEDILYRGGII
jgi:hypothetical protein